MSRLITIAVDAMSGDCGTEVTVPASLNILRQDKDLELLLVGDVEKIYSNNDKVNTILKWKPKRCLDDAIKSEWNWQLKKINN